MIYRHTTFQEINVIGASGAHAIQVRSFAKLQLLVVRKWEVCLRPSSGGILFITSFVMTGENYSKVEMESTLTHRQHSDHSSPLFYVYEEYVTQKCTSAIFCHSVTHGSNYCTSNITWRYVGLSDNCCSDTILFFFSMAQQPQWAMASSLSRRHDHTQTHHTR